jgi:hypothetical protein
MSSFDKAGGAARPNAQVMPPPPPRPPAAPTKAAPLPAHVHPRDRGEGEA